MVGRWFISFKNMIPFQRKHPSFSGWVNKMWIFMVLSPLLIYKSFKCQAQVSWSHWFMVAFCRKYPSSMANKTGVSTAEPSSSQETSTRKVWSHQEFQVPKMVDSWPYKTILGMRIPLHKPYPYSLYRWIPPFSVPEIFGDEMASENLAIWNSGMQFVCSWAAISRLFSN